MEAKICNSPSSQPKPNRNQNSPKEKKRINNRITQKRTNSLDQNPTFLKDLPYRQLEGLLAYSLKNYSIGKKAALKFAQHKVYHLVILIVQCVQSSLFSKFCNCDHCPLSEHFILPKRYSLNNNLHHFSIRPALSELCFFCPEFDYSR